MEKVSYEWSINSLSIPCYVDPRHHGMARLRAPDGGDGLQIRRVAENILSKYSRTADKGQSSSLGIGRRANNYLP